MKHFKYIIYRQNDEIYTHFGYVYFHKQLLPSKPLNYSGYWKEPECLGGGMFMFDFENKAITLYGESSDFGKVDPNILKSIIITNKKEISNDLWYCCLFAGKDDPKYDKNYEFDDWEIKII